MVLPQKKLSVIVPSLNEAENLPSLLDRLAKYATSGEILETIIVDDSSDDNTLEAAEALSHQYPELGVRTVTRPKPRKGYGAVVRFGMEHAIGRYCVIVNADGVDPIELLPFFVKHLEEGARLVQCSRTADQSESNSIPFTYRFYQRLFRIAQRFLLGSPPLDSTYSFKAFDRELLTRIGLASNGFSVSPEIAFKVYLCGERVQSVPGGHGVRRHGVSKFRFRKEGYGYLRVLLRAGLHRLGFKWFDYRNDHFGSGPKRAGSIT